MAELIVALDVPDGDRALALVDRLGDDVEFYKVGLELFTRWGPPAGSRLRRLGKRVFLDLKLLDIPNTVSRTVEAAGAMGAELLTVHATGGPTMVSAAVTASRRVGGPRILAVTLLTSLDAGEVGTIWDRPVPDVTDEVVRLARMAREAGADGVVASPLEAAVLREALGPEALIVTPGIRLEGGDSHDQARIATPAQAVRAGADHLVVGRAVTADPDPGAAAHRIRQAMEAA
jgi:orotidine-5'-phosphate decarboxylase